MDRTEFTQLDIDNVAKINVNRYCTFIIKNDNTLWVTGYNSNGNLGLGDTTDRNIFTKVDIDNVKDISGGAGSSFIIKNDGTAYSCGSPIKSGGNYYQLGLGDNSSRNTFTKINISDVEKIYPCGDHTFLIKTDNTLWGVGNTDNGVLATTSSNGMYTTFKQLTYNTDNIKTLVANNNNAFIIKNDGSVWCTGKNSRGELGNGNEYSQYGFTKISNSLVYQFLKTTKIRKVILGGISTYLVMDDNTLWVAGYNGNGILGLGDTKQRNTFTKVDIDNVKDIFPYNGATLLIKNDNTLYGTGSFSGTQLNNLSSRKYFEQIDYELPNFDDTIYGFSLDSINSLLKFNEFIKN